MAAKTNAPKFAYLDCEAEPILCNAWSVGAPALYYFQVPKPMADQSQSGVRLAPGVASITNVNWPGLRALYVKEVRRFFKVQMQTVWAPAITTPSLSAGRGSGRVSSSTACWSWTEEGMFTRA